MSYYTQCTLDQSIDVSIADPPIIFTSLSLLLCDMRERGLGRIERDGERSRGKERGGRDLLTFGDYKKNLLKFS